MTNKWLNIIAAAVVMAGVVASYAVAQYQISELRGDVKELQKNWQEDHDTLIRIAVDVKWVRANMEKAHAND